MFGPSELHLHVQVVFSYETTPLWRVGTFSVKIWGSATVAVVILHDLS